MKFYFDTLNPSGKDILRGLISPHLEALSPRRLLREISSPALFSRESSYMFVEVNISQAMHGSTRSRKSMNRIHFDTQNLSPHTHSHTAENSIFPIGQRKWDNPILSLKMQRTPFATNQNKL